AIRFDSLARRESRGQRWLILAGDEKHLGGSATQGTVAPPVVGLLHHEPHGRTELRETIGRVEAYPMLAFTTSPRSLPRGANREKATQRIERPLVGYESIVGSAPPVTIEKPGHHSIPAATVPDQATAIRKHTGEFGEHLSIVPSVKKKPE